MMKRSFSLSAISIAVSLAAAVQSQADPFHYTYNWTANPIAIGAGAGGVTLTDEPAITTTNATDTAATNITVFSAATTTADSIPVPASGSNYSLTVTLSDSNVTGTGSITFTGLLQGQLTHDSSNLINVITGVTDQTGAHAGRTFGILDLGGNSYNLPDRFLVSYSGFAAPGPEAQHNQGAISFHIELEASIAERGPTSPEPSSMVLGCFGLMFLGGGVYCARRRKADLLKAAVS